MACKIEDFIFGLEADMKLNFNSYLTAVNTAKGDSLLTPFANESYFVQTLDERVTNYEQFIILQAGNPTLVKSDRGAAAVTYPVAVYMSFDQGTTDGDAAKKLYRYLDALFTYILESFWTAACKPFKVTSLDQMALIDIDKSKRVVATGLVLEVSFGL